MQSITQTPTVQILFTVELRPASARTDPALSVFEVLQGSIILKPNATGFSSLSVTQPLPAGFFRVKADVYLQLRGVSATLGRVTGYARNLIHSLTTRGSMPPTAVYFGNSTVIGKPIKVISQQAWQD